MTYDPKKIKKQIQAESEIHKRFGPGKLWTFLLKDIFHNDVECAKEFLLSDEGGFEVNEVDRLIKQKQTHENIYNQSLICGLEAY